MKHLFLLLTILLITACNTSEEKKKDLNNEMLKQVQPDEKEFPKLAANRYNVAFLIMDGVYNTELTAPFDIFQHTIFRDGIKAMNVFTVANTDQPIVTFEGMRILPDYNYTQDELPKIDILVIPSAEHHLDTDLEDKTMIDFVKHVNKEAQFMTSHCDGAFVLAEAGLLVNSVSTTFPSDIDAMRIRYPKLDIRKEVLLFTTENISLLQVEQNHLKPLYIYVNISTEKRSLKVWLVDWS